MTKSEKKKLQRKFRQFKDQLTKDLFDSFGEIKEYTFPLGFPRAYFQRLKTDYKKCGIEIKYVDSIPNGVLFSVKVGIERGKN